MVPNSLGLKILLLPEATFKGESRRTPIWGRSRSLGAGVMLETASVAFILFNSSYFIHQTKWVRGTMKVWSYFKMLPNVSFKKTQFRFVTSLCYLQGQHTLIALSDMSETKYEVWRSWTDCMENFHISTITVFCLTPWILLGISPW